MFLRISSIPAIFLAARCKMFSLPVMRVEMAMYSFPIFPKTRYPTTRPTTPQTISNVTIRFMLAKATTKVRSYKAVLEEDSSKAASPSATTA